MALNVAGVLAVEAGAQAARADLRLVGGSNLAVNGTDGGPQKPRGNNDDVAIVGNTAFVGGGSNFHGARATPGRICTDWGGVKNVDLSNPANPVLRAPIRIDDPAGIATPRGNPRQTESGTPANGGTSRRFHNVAQSATALDAISVEVPGFKGDLLAVSVARCEPSFFAGGRYEFYNVTNPANPQKIGSFDSPGTPGTFEDIRLFQRDNKVFALGTIAFGASQGPGGEFRYLDVTPALTGGTVTQLGEFPTTKPVGQISTNGCKTFYAGRGVAPTPDRQNAILAFYDGLVEFGGTRTAAVLNLNLASLPSGFGSAPPFFGYPLNGRTVEGNAAGVEPFTGPGGKLHVMVSEDDIDPSLTNLAINASGTSSDHRVCESHMSRRLYQLPGQEQSGQIAYLGRGCPGSKLTGTPDKADDPYLDDPQGKIALLDAGGNNFGGCSEVERANRAIAAGATAVMINLNEEQLNPSNNGPAGGIPSKPVLRAPLSAYRRMQYVPSPVLTGTTFPTTFERTSITNVTVERLCTTPATPAGQPVSCPAGTRSDLERSDISRFKSVANQTDREARGQVNNANPGNQCSGSSCRFEVVPGQSYKAGASLEVASHTAGSFRAAVVWYDANGAALGPDAQIGSLSSVAPRQRFQQTVTAPAGAVRGAVKFEWTGPAAEGTAFAEALSFVPSNLSATLRDNPGEWGAQRILDFSQNPPAEVGSYRSPSSRTFPPPPGAGPPDDPPAIYEPRVARMFGDNIMLTTWMSDGLRVLDVSNPAVPRELGSFVPPAVPDPSPDAGAGSTSAPPRTDSPSLELRRGRSWPTRPLVTGVDVLRRQGSSGTVVISDINGGIYVLDLAVSGAAVSYPGPYPSPSVLCPPASSASAIRGTAANNRITGTVGADRILSAGGDDVVDALPGNDCVDLGTGADRGEGGPGGDSMVGGRGRDRVSGSAGNDRLRGGPGNDRLTAGRGNDRAFGDAGNDLILGSFGNDVLHGVGGNDRVSGSRGRDRINGGSGNDRVAGGSSNDVVRGDRGNDRLDGNSGSDRVSGNSGNDRIGARDGKRDRINCGTGRDRVVADRSDRVARNCERVRRPRRR